MTQTQFEMIVKCIKVGAPAFADELLKSFTNVIDIYNKSIASKDPAEDTDKEVTKAKEEA